MNDISFAQPAVQQRLQQAAHWRLIALLLSCPRGDWRRHLRALAAEVADPALCEAQTAAEGEASETLYHTTFGPGGPAPPREVSYRRALLSGQSLAQLATFYDAFAYAPPGDEPPDHVAVQTDFVAYLHLKEAFALARGDDRQAAIAADAVQLFLAEHLRAVAEPLHAALQNSGIRYLTLAAAALLERVGPAPASVEPAVSGLEIADSDCCLTCGPAAQDL